MIHSMSGGVIGELGAYTFVKVVFDADTDKKPYWYISDFDVNENDKVLAPRGFGTQGEAATVVKVERNVSGQVTPVPLKRARKLISKL